MMNLPGGLDTFVKKQQPPRVNANCSMYTFRFHTVLEGKTTGIKRKFISINNFFSNRVIDYNTSYGRKEVLESS